MRTHTLNVRAIQSGDSLELHWLASPARAPGSMRPGLLAERDGLPVAAIALSSGAVVSDPGDPAEDVVRSLRFLRYQVMRQGGASGAWRSLLRRAGSSPCTAAMPSTPTLGRRPLRTSRVRGARLTPDNAM
jgi:hypothetical protein